jgi:hypothetical protein
MKDAPTFHDIKPLPSFGTSGSWPWFLLAALVVLLVLWLLFRRRRPIAVSIAPVPHGEEALGRIAELRQLRKDKAVGVRELGERLSLTLRTYLARALGFGARELTATEIGWRLESAFQRALPVVPRERCSDFSAELLRILRFGERAEYADNAESSYPLESSEFDRALSAAESSVHTLEEWLKREEERTRSVVETAHAV